MKEVFICATKSIKMKYDDIARYTWRDFPIWTNNFYKHIGIYDLRDDKLNYTMFLKNQLIKEPCHVTLIKKHEDFFIWGKKYRIYHWFLKFKTEADYTTFMLRWL